MAKTSDPGSVAILLELVDEAYDHPAWHGPNLRDALRGLAAASAVRTPAGRRNSMWAIALHCADRKCAVRRKITGEGARGSFPRTGSDWPALPVPADTAAWKADLGLLDEQRRLLRPAVAALDPRVLGERRGTYTVAARLVAGIAAHDLYHAGQVRLLIKRAGGTRGC